MKFAWMIGMILIIMTACSKTEGTTVSKEVREEAVQFQDALGREVVIAHPKKAAVISKSLAHIWHLSGGELAAVSEDVYEEEDMAIKETTVNLGSLKTPDIERIIAEEIDFIVLSAAITDHVKLKDTLEAAGISCAYFDIETFRDYLEVLQIFTDITGQKDRYQKYGKDLEDEIAEMIEGVPEGEKKSVLYVRAFSTGVKAKGSDTMTGHMLKELGCRNIADQNDTLLEDLNMEKIVEEDPEFIFVVTMGESEEKALKAVEESMISNPAWSSLSAVKKGNYHVLPRELFHLKPNDKWAESYRMLMEILYGEQ